MTDEEGENVGDTLAVVAEAMPSVPSQQAGVLALAVMPEAEFEARLAGLKKGRERIARIKRELMEEGTHYGTIPGTPKPTLLQPGAEVLCEVFQIRPDFIPTITYGDNVTSPAVRVVTRCELHLGSLDGPVVGVGEGSANSWEKKHRYRRGERACPACGAIGHIIKGKDEYGGGWLCYRAKGGCGAKFKDGDAAIEGQQVGDVENPDPHDLENNILKMSVKRAHVDGTKRATASSDLFTQDVEDLPGAESQPGVTRSDDSTETHPDADHHTLKELSERLRQIAATKGEPEAEALLEKASGRTSLKPSKGKWTPEEINKAWAALDSLEKVAASADPFGGALDDPDAPGADHE